MDRKFSVNSFHVNVPFLYPLKTSENQRFSDVFREYRNEAFARNALSNKVLGYCECWFLCFLVFFRFPLLRDIFLSFGMCDVSKESIRHICTKEGGGNIAVVIVGGAAESLDARPGSFTVILKDRKGFIKMALSTG